MDKEKIRILQQFEKTGNAGYLAHHGGLTDRLESVVVIEGVSATQRFKGTKEEQQKYELFHQACEDVARGILLNEVEITEIALEDAREMVKKRYEQFLADPKLAAVAHGFAKH